MKIWFGLLAAPVLALSDQAVSYATVGWACTHGQPIAVHAVHALFLVVTAGGLVAAWRMRGEARRDGGEALARERFLSGLAVASGILSLLAIASMWMPAWVIAPCAR